MNPKISIKILIAASLLAACSCAPSSSSAKSSAKKSAQTAPVVTSTEDDRISIEVTVYNDNHGFIKERRNIELSAGGGILEFADVAAKIDPISVFIKPLDSVPDFSVIEQNYEYDLMSHDKLMDKYIGKTIKIIDRNKYHDRADTALAEVMSATGDALAAAANADGDAIFRSIKPMYQGREEQYQEDVEYLRAIRHKRGEAAYLREVKNIRARFEEDYPEEQFPEKYAGLKSDAVYKIDGEIYLDRPGVKVLPGIPDNLVSRPTLSWDYRSDRGGEQQLEVSYSTGGMNWNADYVLVLGGADSGSRLSGWVTVDNKSGASYENAKLKLVAGKVNKAPPADDGIGYLDNPTPVYITEMDDPSCGDCGFVETKLFEYYMYDLQRPATVKNNQTKQIALMDAPGVAVEKEYVVNSYSVRWDSYTKRTVTAYLKFKNAKENGLGSPLPAGTVRVFAADIDGREQYVAEDRIEHTPKDEEVRLNIGPVSDIVAARTQIDYKEIAERLEETEWTVAVRNRKGEDVVVGVVESLDFDLLGSPSSWEVLEASHEYTEPDANTIRFDVAVGSGQEVTVRYRIRRGR
jgi:hypothetical protein